MQRKKLCRKLLLPPLWQVLLLSLLSAVTLVWVFMTGRDGELIAYGVYVLSFYALCTVCIACWKRLPGFCRRVKDWLYSNPHCRRYFTAAAFKTHVSLYRSRLCAFILLTVNLALSGAVLMMVSFNRGFDYPGMLIYVVALYTFYITTAAIVELIKYRRYKSPVMSMAKLIKLAAALVSMLSLETAMFSQFGGEMSLENQRIMLIATGGGVSAVVVAMAVHMILRTTKEIKEIRRYSLDGQQF